MVRISVRDTTRVRGPANGDIPAGVRGETGYINLDSGPVDMYIEDDTGYGNAYEMRDPFNPETWIPYRLSEASDVVLIIRDMSGREVCRFQLRSQPAGEYVDKGRAIHWDGKNEAGEEVSSGVYFYTLKAGGFTQTGKLVIAR